jgi:hypothetical protein
MPVLAAFALTKLKYGIAVVWTWLCHRSFWQLVCMALIVLILVQHLELVHARKTIAGCEKRYSAVNAELAKLTSAKNDQQAVTVERIKVVTKTIHDADQRAKAVETAPPAKDCRTKPEVMGADL